MCMGPRTCDQYMAAYLQSYLSEFLHALLVLMPGVMSLTVKDAIHLELWDAILVHLLYLIRYFHNFVKLQVQTFSLIEWWMNDVLKEEYDCIRLPSEPSKPPIFLSFLTHLLPSLSSSDQPHWPHPPHVPSYCRRGKKRGIEPNPCNELHLYVFLVANWKIRIIMLKSYPLRKKNKGS